MRWDFLKQFLNRALTWKYCYVHYLFTYLFHYTRQCSVTWSFCKMNLVLVILFSYQEVNFSLCYSHLSCQSWVKDYKNYTMVACHRCGYQLVTTLMCQHKISLYWAESHPTFTADQEPCISLNRLFIFIGNEYVLFKNSSWYVVQ